MQKNILLRSLVVLSIVCLVFGIVKDVRAQSPEEDVFAVITLNNLEAFLLNVGQVIDQFSPGMGAMANTMMIGSQVFNNPNLAGIDKNGEYMAVILNPMKYPQEPFAFIIPLTNKDEYLGVLSQSLTGGEDVNGVYTFTQPDQKNFLVAFSGNRGVISRNSDVAAQVKMLVESDSQLLKEAPVVKGQVTAFVSVNKILTATRPIIEMLKQQLLMRVEMGMQPPQGEGAGEGTQAPPAEAVKNILQAEVDILLSLLEQTEKLQLGVGLEAEGLRLSKAVFATGGSNLEKFMAAQTPKKSSLMGFIPADSGMIGTVSLNTTPEFVEGYLSFVKMMGSLDPAKDEAMLEQMTGWTKQWLEILDGAEMTAGALSQTEESLAFGVNEVKDGVKAKALIEQYQDMFQTMAGFYKDMGIDLNLTLADRSEFKGGEIFDYDFGFKADMIPDPEGREMFNKIFGESVAFPIGVLGNYQVMGFGKGSHGLVEKIMEQLDSGADVAAKYTPAMFGLPEENNMFIYMSLPKLTVWVGKYRYETPKNELVESPGLGMTGTFVDSHFEGELYLPIAEVQAIQKMAQQRINRQPVN